MWMPLLKIIKKYDTNLLYLLFYRAADLTVMIGGFYTQVAQRLYHNTDSLSVFYSLYTPLIMVYDTIKIYLIIFVHIQAHDADSSLDKETRKMKEKQ